MPEVLDALPRVITDVVAPGALAVDRDGVFPVAAIDALRDIGVFGLTSAPEMGGGGGGLGAAAAVIEQLAGACGSTAMIVLMHYAATSAIEAAGSDEARRDLATHGRLSTLAFSEAGSRSHFWAPLGTATARDGRIQLDAHKSWITAAGIADTYVWSSRPVAGDDPMTLWLVPSDTPGLSAPGPFDGFGLRGNASAPIAAAGVEVGEDAMLGSDGGGLDLALQAVLPWFLVLSGAFSLGVMEAVTAESRAHLLDTRLEHLDQSLAQQLLPRTDLARMRIQTDATRALLTDTLSALEAGRADAMLRVLEIKAAAAEASLTVTDLAMKVCGGAAFRKDVGIERRFRDARAARVMAPTTEALLDFVGRAVFELPLLERVMATDTLLMGAVAYDPKVVTIWDGFRAWFRDQDLDFDYVLYSNYERQVEELVAGRIHAAWNSPLAWVRARRLAAASGIDIAAVAMRDTDQDLTSIVVTRAETGIATVDDLRGRTVAVGAIDSPQATLIPLALLRAAGLEPGLDFDVRRFDIGVGLHGDHIGGEREAARALVAGEVDAACMIDGNHLAFTKEGTLQAGTIVVAQTDRYDHCNMSVVPGAAPAGAMDRFADLLLSMSYDDASVRPLLDLEGLKQWRPGRLDGYEQLERAVDAFGFYDTAGTVTSDAYRP